MSIYLKTQPSIMTTSSSFHKYDIYNPFNPQYPKPFLYQNYSYTQSPSLNRELVKGKNNFYNEKVDHLQQIRRQQALISKKQKEYYEILYGEGSKFLSLNNSASYTNFQTTPRHQLIERNPFLQGEPSSITHLKEKHANAKLEFNSMYEKQQSSRMNQFDERQQQELKLKHVLQNKEFRSLVELKNLQEYRKIKQAQKLASQFQSQQRRSLMNVSVQNTSGNNNKGSTLFSFGNETLSGRKFGTKQQMSSRFAISQRQKMDNILEEQEGYDMRITFSGKKQTEIIQSKGFRQAKRPPTMAKKSSDDKRNSLSNIKVNGVDSPKTIKLKNKTFYLIAA